MNDATARWCGHTLVIGADDRLPEDLVATLPAERDRHTVLLAGGTSLPTDLVARLIREELPDTASIRLATSTADAGALAQRLADQLDIEIVAPEGPTMLVAPGSLFVVSRPGAAAWRIHRPGTRPRTTGAPRHPAPQWQVSLPKPRWRPSGLAAHDLPAGFWLHRPQRRPLPADDPAYAIEVADDRIVVLVGQPDRRPPSPRRVYRWLERLPLTALTRLVLMPYGPWGSLLDAVAARLSTDLQVTVRRAAGPAARIHGAGGYVTVDAPSRGLPRSTAQTMSYRTDDPADAAPSLTAPATVGIPAAPTTPAVPPTLSAPATLGIPPAFTAPVMLSAPAARTASATLAAPVVAPATLFAPQASDPVRPLPRQQPQPEAVTPARVHDEPAEPAPTQPRSPEAAAAERPQRTAAPPLRRQAGAVPPPPVRRSNAHEHSRVRSHLGTQYDVHARDVAKLLVRLPGIRPGVDEPADAVVTDLVAVSAALRPERTGAEPALRACLLSGLNRLPTFIGGVLASAPADPAPYRPGDVLIAPGLLRAGREQPSAERHDVLAIYSLTGRRPGVLSDRHEVLFAPGTVFGVLDAATDADGVHQVLLRELAEPRTGGPSDEQILASLRALSARRR